MATTNGKKTSRDRDAALTWAVPPALEASAAGDAAAAADDGAWTSSAAAAANRAGFARAAEAHLAQLVQQQLATEGVSNAEGWGPIVVRLAQQAAASLSPTAITAHGDIDPRHYVKVKRVLGGGEPSASSVVQGVVFRKNVAHKRMRTSITQAGVLLLAGALEWQPAQSKLQQFDTLLSEEQAFLQAAVARIASFSPDVLVVERSVARYAQELLLERDIALVLNVKRELLDRIALCTDAEVVPSLDKLSSHSLGFCKEFEVLSIAQPNSQQAATAAAPSSQRNSVPSSPRASAMAAAAAAAAAVAQQPLGEQHGHLIADAAALRRSSVTSAVSVRGGPNTLMLFKGCPRPLGCTILLKGPTAAELTRVKRVVGFATYAAYWNRLEADLMADQLASAAAAASAIPQLQPLLQGAGDAEAAAGGMGAPDGGGAGAAAFWEALAAACAEASARSAAEEREEQGQPVMSPSPHITFVGDVEEEHEGAAGGDASGETGQLGDAASTARWAAGPGTTPAASAASSPTKSAAGAAAAAAGGLASAAAAAAAAAAAQQGAQPEQLPALAPSNSVGLRDEAVLKSLLVGEDSSASDPWVVPADADGATITIAGHAPLGSDASTPALRKSASQASLPGAAARTGQAAAGAAVLDPLSQAALEIAQQLAGLDGDSSDGEGEEGEAEPGLATLGSEPSAADLVLAEAGLGPAGPQQPPPLPPISTRARAGTLTTDSSPKLPAGRAGSVAGSGAGEEPGSAAAAAVYSRQQLWVSISCKNPAKGILCEPPHTHCMTFYGKDDMSLAHFLAAATPTNRKCPHPTCGEGAMLHLRSFMHGDGLVTLSSVRLPAGQELPGRDKGQIWLWLRPTGKVPAVQEDVRRVALSTEAACMSFAHLLALLLDARFLSLGGQSLQRDYVRYLGSGSTVLCLHHSQVTPYVVHMPAHRVALNPEAQVSWLLEEVKGLTEEADEAFGAIQYAVAEQLQGLEDEDPEFVGSWLSNLADTRTAFMELMHSVGSGVDPRTHQRDGAAEEHQQEQQLWGGGSTAATVWELNRLRRLLAFEVLQWATALHDGTPVARAAPPQAVVAGSLSETLSRHSRQPSLESVAATEGGGAAAATATAAQPQPAPPAAAVQEPSTGAAEAAGAGAAAAPGAAPTAAALPPLPPDGRPAPAVPPGLATSHYRRSSVSLGQHIKSAMPAAASATPPTQLPSANYAPSLQRDTGDAASSVGSEQPPQQPPIPIGLVARYVSLFDDGTRGRGSNGVGSAGGAPSEPRPAAQAAQQRTFDWVQRASPSDSEVSYSSSLPNQHSEAADGGRAGGPQGLSGDESEAEDGGAGRAEVRQRRPSMRIDLANPDPELVSAFSPPSEGSLAGAEGEEEHRPGHPFSAFEKLASRFGRLALRRSLNERRSSAAAEAPAPPEPTVGFAPEPAAEHPKQQQKHHELPRQPETEPAPVKPASEPTEQPSAAAEPSVAAAPAAAAVADGAESAGVAGGAGDAVCLAATESEGLELHASAKSASHFEEWSTLLKSGSGQLAEPEAGPSLAPVQEAPPPAAAAPPLQGPTPALDWSLQKAALASATTSLAKLLPQPTAPTVVAAVATLGPQPPSTVAPSASAPAELPAALKIPAAQAPHPAPGAQPAQASAPAAGEKPAPAGASAADQVPQPQRAPSKLKQLLGRLRLDLPDTPVSGQTPLTAGGKVELSGRSLLPPGVDDMQVTIFDEEPTSVIAYFLSTRVYQQYLKDAVASIVSGSAGTAPGQQRSAAAPAAGSAAGPATAAAAGAGAPASAAQQEGGGQPAVPALAAAAASGPSAGEPPAGDAAGSVHNATSTEPATGAAPQQPPQPRTPRTASATTAAGEGSAEQRGANRSSRGQGWEVLFSEQRLDCQLSIEDMSPGMPWGRAKFQVVAYYAPQFAELRGRCVAGGEGVFLASISRCRKWASRGGKSNVYFAKTRDDRYIVKQLSKSERQSFLEFAPDYFRYVAATLARGQDTCLAKILGVFQVSVKYANTAFGVPLGVAGGARDGVIDLLIQENLLYGRTITRIFDLKGSERDRYVADNTIAGAVLLDENLKEMNLSSPTLVSPLAFARLQRALWSDTAFLSGLGVMDYSLLVGVDKQRQELVVGVIDFIRQYTWDKQVETWVKKSGILGGAGKDPTVISPKQYCRRFRVAISGYITVVPSLLPPPPPLDPDAI